MTRPKILDRSVTTRLTPPDEAKFAELVEQSGCTRSEKARELLHFALNHH